MAVWIDKDGGSTLKMVGGLFEIVIEYVYNERPGLRIIAAGAVRRVLPGVYTDIEDAKKEALVFIKKFSEEYQKDLLSVDKK